MQWTQKVIGRIKVQRAILFNRWSLQIACIAIKTYRKYSKPFVDQLSVNMTLWNDELDAEEKRIDSVQKILERRLARVAQSHK